MSEGLREDVIYRIVYGPTSMEYATVEDGEITKHYSMKRALRYKPLCPLKIVTSEEWNTLTP